MCGIVGIWHFDGEPVDEGELIAARDRLVTRGPDDAGLWIGGAVGLGHRRLSIIDLSPSGRMPMFNETGSIAAVFNGEIYNFKTLRDELSGTGHVFKSKTDSEVVVHAYEQWGTDCFRRFDGMFAIAVWDRAARRLVLARDIAGEKPLYFAHAHDHVRFASTPKALLAFRNARNDINAKALRTYLELGYVPAPLCIFAGMAKVEPGAFVVIEPERPPRSARYWTLKTRAGSTKMTEDDATDHLQSVLRAAVRSRLVADVPLGAFLSGGVDSSLIVAMMAEAGKDVRSFTIGFQERAWDESEYAHRVAKHLGVENTVSILTPADVLRELPAVSEAFDEPMADSSVLPSLAVARLARRHVTVALTGDGADEAFGGYRYYSAVRLFETISQFVPRAVRQEVARRSGWMRSERLERALQRVAADDAAAYFGRSGFYRGATAGGAARRVINDAELDTPVEQRVAAEVRQLHGMRATEAALHWDASHTLPDAWLMKVDRTTMAVSLEARAPFLARSVLETAFALPLDARVRVRERKVVLRRLLARYLPADLIERPKQGFAPPVRSWFEKELASELRARLTFERMACFPVIDPQGVLNVLDEHRSGEADHTQLLWALFVLDRWRDAHVK